MAGFDDNKQRSFTIPGGGRGEAGYFEFSGTSITVDVPTRMTTMYEWNTQVAADPSYSLPNPFTNGIDTDADISNGAVTFTRETMRADLSQKVYYSAKGW